MESTKIVIVTTDDGETLYVSGLNDDGETWTRDRSLAAPLLPDDARRVYRRNWLIGRIVNVEELS